MNRRIVLRMILAVIVFAAAAVLLWGGGMLTPQGLVTLIPSQPFAAVLLFLFCYFLKSVTLFFPVLVIQAAAGAVFPAWAALLLNGAGCMLSIAVSYGMGAYSTGGWLERKIEQYPKLQNIVQKQQNNVFGLSFLLRLPGCFPMDVTSVYLGMLRLSFFPYFWGSFLGLLPHVLLGTLLGTTANGRNYLEFWIVVALIVCLALVSGFFYRWRQKKQE